MVNHKKYKSKSIRKTTHVRVKKSIHKALKIEATDEKVTISQLVERLLLDGLKISNGVIDYFVLKHEEKKIQKELF